jgi:hypothetical protein
MIGMYGPTAAVVERLDSIAGAPILDWGCPVPFFGQLSTARIATVGINPSSREFVDEQGTELTGADRRLPSLTSLGIRHWGQADSAHLRRILDACTNYFLRNPYDRWFKVLEYVLSNTGATYYGLSASACHLDLVPFATSSKWGVLPGSERRALLDASCDLMGLYLRDSQVELLVLNGRSVVQSFERTAEVRLETRPIPDTSLPRSSGRHVDGVAYFGTVEVVGGIDLSRRIKVIGYNHNVQSSFGVTAHVLNQIRAWVGEAGRGIR